MINYEAQDVKRKVMSILRVLSDSQEPLGGRIIGRRLKEYNINLTERTVRYHLKLMDERGFTQGPGRRGRLGGRLITESGLNELKSALVSDKIGFIIDKIESLSHRTSFDWEKRRGQVPVNTAIFPERKFKEAVDAMKEAFKAKLCVSGLVDVAKEGEKLGEIVIPKGKVGFATICSVMIYGAFVKAGIPMDSRFGGILQIRGHKPSRFTELIDYAGSSLEPSEVFIAKGMTSIGGVAREGKGEILASFQEIPALYRPAAETILEKLRNAGIGGLIKMGDKSEAVCEIPVGLNKVGLILQSGLNPVAAAAEAGIEVTNHAMSGLVEYESLKSFWDL
jgi:repressor of nif and glnA expression